MSPLLYGETLHTGIAEMILFAQEEYGIFQETSNDKIAIDLGSGIGKPSLTFALVLN